MRSRLKDSFFPNYGLAISKSRQILRAVNSLISRWRGKLEVLPLEGLRQMA